MSRIIQKNLVPSYDKYGTIGKVTNRETGVTFNKGELVRVGPRKQVVIEEFVVLGDTMIISEGETYHVVLAEKVPYNG